jgi:hypothetical protein
MGLKRILTRITFEIFNLTFLITKKADRQKRFDCLDKRIPVGQDLRV